MALIQSPKICQNALRKPIPLSDGICECPNLQIQKMYPLHLKGAILSAMLYENIHGGKTSMYVTVRAFGSHLFKLNLPDSTQCIPGWIMFHMVHCSTVHGQPTTVGYCQNVPATYFNTIYTVMVRLEDMFYRLGQVRQRLSLH